MIGPGPRGLPAAGTEVPSPRAAAPVLIRRADRRNALEQRDDLVARQGLIFQQAPRQHIQIRQIAW